MKTGYLKGVAPSIYKLQSLITLAQAAAVQNTWYTVCNLTGDLEIDMTSSMMSTLAEDIEVSMTIDGINPIDGAQAGAVAGTNYYIYISSDSTQIYSIITGGEYYTMKYFPLRCRSFKMEVRKTTANAANTLRGSSLYHRRP